MKKVELQQGPMEGWKVGANNKNNKNNNYNN